MLDVIVVGGGPVGLFLGSLLAQGGAGVQVLERRTDPRPHSRAIGIHAPALEAFEGLGLTPRLLAAGLPVRRGLLRGPSGVLGELNFARVSRRYPFVLSLPQRDSEALLEARLRELAPTALRRGVGVRAVEAQGDAVRVVTEGGETLHARFVVGADGRRSGVRAAAGLAWRGGPYRDTYLMGDFPDTTAYGPAAVIQLTADGVVESFPLPGGLRRWVAGTSGLLPTARPAALTQLIGRRTGFHLPTCECRMLSAFEVRRHLAERMVRGRLVLIGDAAHEISPIGGQGMNLGWLDAAALAPLLLGALAGTPHHAALARFERVRRRSAMLAARQAELNMFLGRPLGHLGRGREALLFGLLHSPAREALALAYSMRWL